MISEHRSQLTFFYAFFLTLAMPVGTSANDLFFDDFEDRARDDETIGNNWTWYDQTFGTDECVGDFVFGFGPFDTAEDDYVHPNRNFWTASQDQGGDGNYFRAGLEVPAWTTIDESGQPGGGALSNMLRVYGNSFATAQTCQRTLIFQEMDITEAGPFTFSFESTQDQFGAPQNGETTFGFVKILSSSDFTFDELVFEQVETTRSDTGARVFEHKIDFVIPEEYVGELLQFGFYNDVTQSQGQTFDHAGAYYDNVRLTRTDIGPGHSGTFFNADQSGHGFSIEFGESNGNPIGVVYWYTYDDQGNNVYLIGNGTPNGNILEVNFTSALGMIYGEFDPDTVTRENGGTGVFEFTSRDSAIFSYEPSAFSEDTFGHTTPVDDLELVKLFPIAADDEFSDED